MQSQIPREQVSQFLGDLYTNPNFETNMDNFKILKIGNIVKRGNNFYVLVDYSAETNIFFTKDASDEFIEKAKNHFKELYNERYSYNDSDKVIVTSRDFEILVINENNIWSHIPGIVKLRPYLNYWIEEDVIEEIFE